MKNGSIKYENGGIENTDRYCISNFIDDEEHVETHVISCQIGDTYSKVYIYYTYGEANHIIGKILKKNLIKLLFNFRYAAFNTFPDPDISSLRIYPRTS